MPALKQLRCEIEWGNTKNSFAEYAITYGDGVVETYIAIPDHPQPFAVHLTSKNYIAEGLAMLVFMDGDYQCNRNRLNLKPLQPGIPRDMTEIDLRVRQKEKSLGDGTYLGRGWRFEKHNILPVDQLPSNMDRQHFEDLGTIDVFVLRCRAKEEVDIRSTTSSDVDDSPLPTSDPINGTSPEESAHSNTTRPPPTETQPDTFASFMNDGAADVHQFGLDGEGPGPAEQKAWSWNAPYPPVSAAYGPSGVNMPGQPTQAQSQQYGSYGHPSGFSRRWPPGPPLSQGQPPSQRPQRHVHFNDQLPRPPSSHEPSAQGFNGQTFSADRGQWQERENQEQPRNYRQKTESDYSHQPLGHGPTSGGYANPSLMHGGTSGAQVHTRGFPFGGNFNFPSPMPTYQPIEYGVPGYPGWPTTANHAGYAQTNWPGQSMPGPNYLTPQSFATPYQSAHPYLYPQPSFAGGQMPSIPPPASNHPGGGTWGPPPPKPISQDPAKDENGGWDAQSNQNHDRISNADGHWSENNSQGWGNQDSDKTQAGDSGWNGNETGGGDTNNWDKNSTQMEPWTSDWNQPPSDFGHNTNGDTFGNTNAGTSTQVQDSWNSAPATNHQVPEPSSLPQQSSSTAPPAQRRPLYGPHGPYYDAQPSSATPRLQPDAGEEPPYDVPADMLTTHQVKSGEGHVYVHKRRSPEYLDSLEEPYARFVFKYRTKEQIKNQIGISIDDEPTGDEEKRRLQVMDKNDIIEMLLRAKTALGGEIPSPPHVAPEPDERRERSTEATAIPAPTYSFLDYQVPAARTANNIPPPGNTVPVTSTPAPPASNTPDSVGNKHWSDNSAVPAAPIPAPAAQQPQQNANTWTAPQQQQPPRPQSTDSWGNPPGPAQPQQQAQPQPQPAISPVQLGTDVQTYKRPTATGPPQPQPGTATDRPITPPDGGWNAHAHTAPSSSASDNGMAGWDQGGGGGGATGTGAVNAGGWGWGGSATAAPTQPSGGW